MGLQRVRHNLVTKQQLSLGYRGGVYTSCYLLSTYVPCGHGFSSGHVWMSELDYKESWVPKNWCFCTVVLEKTLDRVPWTARRSNQSIRKEISPEYSMEGLMLKLKLQYFGHLMPRTDSSEKTLMLGKIEGRRRRGWQRMRWLDGIVDSMDMNMSELQELLTQWTWIWVNSRSWWGVGRPGVLQSMGSQRVGHDLATELNWLCTMISAKCFTSRILPSSQINAIT